MSIFLFLNKTSYDYRIGSLRNQCIDKFKLWINKSLEYDLKNIKADANDKSDSDKSNIYELRNVVSKICFAYEACRQYTELNEETKILGKYLTDAQLNDGSYGVLCEGKSNNLQGNIITTALVLRAYLLYSPTSQNTIQAMNYLKLHASKLTNIFEQLYVYNSIQIILNGNSNLATNDFNKFYKNISKCLKTIFSTVALNPTSFTNPINIDFNDNGRTRYYRLYSDLILIEALALSHPTDLYYLKGKLGKRVLSKVWECTNYNTQKDSTSHRISFGFYHELSQLFSIIRSRYNENEGLLSRMQGRLLRLRLFGIDLNKELYIVLCSSPFIGLLLLFNYTLSNNFQLAVPAYVNTVLAFLLARVANIFGLIYDNKQKDVI